MTLIIVKNKQALDIPSLKVYVLKYIYERETMKPDQIRLMMESVTNWKDHLEYKRSIGMSAVDEENQIILEAIGMLLYKDQNGDLDERKEQFKRHGIDYKKFHRLPGAVTNEDLIRGQMALEQARKANPQDYT